MNSARILVVTDDKLTQKSLFEMLCRFGYHVDVVNAPKGFIAYPSEKFSEKFYQVILAELKKDGCLDLLKRVKDRGCQSKVIVLASYGNAKTAATAVKAGAFDYLIRPVEDAKIISVIKRALASSPIAAPAISAVKKVSEVESTFFGLVGNTSSMKNIYYIIERLSNSKTTVLLRGESGTGKRVIARAIHKVDKKRKNKPFVEICCGALPREIIESELFGHTKGAFTGAINDRKGRFELADGGTVLLDDIDSLPLDLQVKLLRVLQEKEFEKVGDNRTIKVDVRIIVSTNQDLEKAIAEKRFREDLYYRLNVISLYMPPLRERKEDLSLLVDHFINLYSKENHKKIKGISEEAFGVLTAYRWPGNIRELENIIERAVILDIDGLIDTADLPEIIINGVEKEAFKSAAQLEKDSATLKDALEEPERIYILKVLTEAGWNKKQAAKKLGVNRTTLYNKLRKYNLLSYVEKNNKDVY